MDAKDIGESLSLNVQPVDYPVLKKMLPKVRGFNQVDSRGEQTAIVGIRISQAEAEYEGRGDRRLTVKIIDYGSVKGLVGKATLAWMSAEIDRKSDTGYERTTKYRGYQAFEKYSKPEKEGSLSLIVEERFLVTVDGEDVDMKDIKRAMDAVNLKKLGRMRNHGVEE